MDNFDWKFYLRHYPDLQQGNINTKKKAYTHWIKHGRKEGRICNKLFYDNINEQNNTIFLKNNSQIIKNNIQNTDTDIIINNITAANRNTSKNKHYVIQPNINDQCYYMMLNNDKTLYQNDKQDKYNINNKPDILEETNTTNSSISYISKNDSIHSEDEYDDDLSNSTDTYNESDDNNIINYSNNNEYNTEDNNSEDSIYLLDDKKIYDIYNEIQPSQCHDENNDFETNYEKDKIFSIISNTYNNKSDYRNLIISGDSTESSILNDDILFSSDDVCTSININFPTDIILKNIYDNIKILFESFDKNSIYYYKNIINNIPRMFFSGDNNKTSMEDNINENYNKYYMLIKTFYLIVNRMPINLEILYILNNIKNYKNNIIKEFIKEKYTKSSTTSKIPNNINSIGIFCMVKNSDDIIEEWIQWHSTLVGINNIYIINNNSVDNTFDILKTYVKNGLNLYTFKNKFEYKWLTLTQIMNDNKDKYDLLIPLDSDEFIILEKNNIPCSNINDIIKYIKSLPINGHPYKFTKEYFYIIKNEKFNIKDINTFIKMDRTFNRKTFYLSQNFGTTDLGSHSGFSLNKFIDYNNTKLALAHFEIRSFKQLYNKINMIRDFHNIKNDKCVPMTGINIHWKFLYNESLNSLDNLYNNYIKTGDYLIMRKKEGITVYNIKYNLIIDHTHKNSQNISL